MRMHSDATFQSIVDYTRSIYGPAFIPLHRPVFEGNEKQYLIECIDSNFVSSVGAKVVEFEQQVAAFTGAKFAVATVNGTAALHVALQLVGVQQGAEVITQALTFIATCNALSYAGAHPVFVDVDLDTMGLSPAALRQFLEQTRRTAWGPCFQQDHGSPHCSVCAHAHLWTTLPHRRNCELVLRLRHSGCGRRR
jgi:perosamine synthetase